MMFAVMGFPIRIDEKRDNSASEVAMQIDNQIKLFVI
jgi:hypothetical protein